MNDKPPIEALAELRAEFEVAAQRAAETRSAESAPGRRERWSRRRRVITVVVSVLTAGAAVATGAQLISVGDELKDRDDKSERYRPGPKGSEVVATAPDPAGGAQWAVATYRTADGEACAIAGQVRLGVLGVVRDGTFHPYEQATAGICGDLREAPLVFDQRVFESDDGPRSVIYGRVSEQEREVTATQAGQTDVAPVRDGAFLLVLEGALAPGDVDVRVKP